MKKRHRKGIGFAKVRQSMAKGKNNNVTTSLLTLLCTKKLQSKCWFGYEQVAKRIANIRFDTQISIHQLQVCGALSDGWNAYVSESENAHWQITKRLRFMSK